ncbi:hypothetical protein BHYA_0032g00150 [Botrytis hyacinthi]|uniref:Uncharacterized protein n=1 Tax=Botrytis hyacinthi TaxID=278943 RepID=A0A4Z1GV31_9HELO|nr:hypothetical protein BHYA_0032g00150 [Botrytis hyacinthi]
MEVENERKLGVLRAEQCEFNTAIKAFNKSLAKAREATECFNKKSRTLNGKLMAAKHREKSFSREYEDKQSCLVEREQRIDAKWFREFKTENWEFDDGEKMHGLSWKKIRVDVDAYNFIIDCTLKVAMKILKPTLDTPNISELLHD